MKVHLFAFWWFAVLGRVEGWGTLTDSALSGWKSGGIPDGDGSRSVTLAPSRGVGFEYLVIAFEYCAYDASKMSRDHVYLSYCNSPSDWTCTTNPDFPFPGAATISLQDSDSVVVKIRVHQFSNGCKLNNRLIISYRAKILDGKYVLNNAQFPRDCYKWGKSLVYPYGTPNLQKTDEAAQGHLRYRSSARYSDGWFSCSPNSCMWGTRYWVALNDYDNRWYSEKTVNGVTFQHWYMDEWCACMPGFYAVNTGMYYASDGGYDSSDARPPDRCRAEPAAHDKIECNACETGYYCPGGAYFDARCPAKAEDATRYDCGKESCTFMTHEPRRAWKTCPQGQGVSFPGSPTADRECALCGIGKYNDVENGECKSCPPGTYQDEIGQTACKYCLGGKYSDAAAAASCRDCDAGKYAATTIQYLVGWTPGAASSCNNCVEGFSKAGQHECYAWQNCENGFGSTPLPNARQDTTCVSCESGKFRNRAIHKANDPCQTYRVCGTGEYLWSEGTSSQDRVCLKCQPGKFKNKNSHLDPTCEPCPLGLGTEQADSGKAECISCGSGRYATSAGICQSCPAGKYWESSTAGTTACTNCGFGDYSYSGQSSCYQCDAGHFSNAPKNQPCTPCGPGSYADERSQHGCKSCPAGKFSNASVNTNCSGVCPAGSYSEARSSACTLCEPGKFSDRNASAQCAQCNRGYFSNATGATSSTTCQQCPVEGYTEGTGASACKQCAWDFPFPSDEKKGCRDKSCDDGQVPAWTFPQPFIQAFGGVQGCRSCEFMGIKFYENTTLSPGRCIPCPACSEGKYWRTSSSGLMLLTCQWGSNCADCDKCKLGESYYARNCSQYLRSRCEPCGSPCKSSEYQVQNCTLYQPRICKICTSLCPEGQYMVSPCNATSDMQCAPCINCTAGSYESTPCTTQSPRNCTICSPGTVANSRNQAFCAQCETGKFAKDPGSSTCSVCSAGSFISSAGSTVCKICSNGTFSIREGVSSCTACPAGSFLSNAKLGNCTLCPAGTFSQFSGRTDCELCQPGKYSPDPNATRNNSACLNCPRGTYSPQVRSPNCTLCPAGSYSDLLTGPTVCLLCPAGKYASAPGSSTCLSCAPGNFSASDGAALCQPCPIGTASSKSQSTSCQPCSQGTYASSVGQSVCQTCAAPCVLGSRYASVNCTPSTNRVCSSCAKALCPLGFTSNVSWCPPSGVYDCTVCPYYGNDNVHLLPEYSCATCPDRNCGLTPGTYMPKRTSCSSFKTSFTLNDTYTCARCKGCTYRQYVVGWGSCNGEGTSDMSLNPDNPDMCMNCENSCKPGQYVANLCNGRTMNNTEVCKDCASCPYGSYHAKPLRGYTHPQYDGGVWIPGYDEKPCTGSGILASDGVTDCERCDTCPFGKYASDVGRCTGNGIWKDPFTCTDCKPCPSGYEHDAPCDGMSFSDKCKLCPACLQGEYMVSHWNNTLKRMICGCQRCFDAPGDICPIHYRKTGALCTGMQPYDEACAQCTLCNAGEYIADNAFCSGATFNDTSAGKCRWVEISCIDSLDKFIAVQTNPPHIVVASDHRGGNGFYICFFQIPE